MEKKLQEAIASLMKSGDKEALAQLIVEFVNPTHIATDFVSLLMNTRSLKPGDALVKKVRKGVKVRTLVPGAMHLASEITVADRINYILDGADVKVTANAWELESGELGTVGEIKSELMASLKDYYLNKVFTALSSVWSGTNTPDNYTTVATTVTASVLENAINQINQNSGGVKAVIGTRAALTPITKFGAFWSDGTNTAEVPSAIEEIMANGWLGKYYGAPLLAIDQQYDNPDDYNALIPNDKILVIGHNVGEFITYGDVKTKEWEDMRPTPPQWYLEIYQQFGLIVDKAAGIYVIKIT